MVERIKNQKVRFKKTTGPIRLSVDDLIDYLSNTQIFEFTTFEATCNGYKFASIDDMKANRELLAGRPSIYGMFENSTYHDFTIEFDESAIINAYSVSSEQHIAILNKASTNLNSVRGPLFALKYFSPTAAWGVIWGAVIIFFNVLAKALEEEIINDFIRSGFLKLLCLLVLVATLRLLLSKRKPIFFGKKSQLSEKIKENALSHVIVFAIGISLTWLVTKFGLTP